MAQVHAPLGDVVGAPEQKQILNRVRRSQTSLSDRLEVLEDLTRDIQGSLERGQDRLRQGDQGPERIVQVMGYPAGDQVERAQPLRRDPLLFPRLRVQALLDSH